MPRPRHRLLALAVLAALFASLLVVPDGHAQREPTPPPLQVPAQQLPSGRDTAGGAFPVLVVDLQEVRRRSSAVDAVQRQIEARRTRYEADLTELEQSLQQEQRELLESRSEMSGEDYTAAVQNLEARLDAARQSMRATKANLDRLFRSGMLEIDRTIVAVAEELAVERGARLVLPKAGVLLVRSELEVTESVIARLNERLPSLDLATLAPRP